MSYKFVLDLVMIYSETEKTIMTTGNKRKLDLNFRNKVSAVKQK